jgi:hypothetical protein
MPDLTRLEEPAVPTGQGSADGAAKNAAGFRKAVFLSHSSADRGMAERMCARLEARGIACWMAPRDVTPGRPYADECRMGVAESASLVLLASEKSLGSVQVLSELEQAHKRSHPIYTVLIPPARVQGEVDFYLSRLHWLQSAGRTPEDLAETLASVINCRDDGQEAWEEVASPPTLRRTMKYRPVAFAKLVAASAVALVLLLGGAAFTVNRLLDRDFRRLGYITLAAEPGTNGHPLLAHAQVWLMAEGVAFHDVRLNLATETAAGTQQHAYAGWTLPEQVGSMQQLDIPLDAGVQHLTTCLVVPSPGLHAPYRVIQRFALASASDGIDVAETAEKSVIREDGSPCRPLNQ